MMAGKCANSIINWHEYNPTLAQQENIVAESDDKIKQEDEEEIDLGADVNAGERILDKKLEAISKLILLIGNDFMTILNSATVGDNKWVCIQVERSLIGKLNDIKVLVEAVIEKICKIDVISANRHRYFIYFNSGLMDRLNQLVSIIGRLSDVPENIYNEDRLRPLACDQSIFLHCLNSAWSFLITMMESFEKPGREVIFKDQIGTEEYEFLDEMDFFNAARKYGRIFLMDLLVTGWIKFNQSAKMESLIKGSPFTCPCSGRRFLATLKIATGDQSHHIYRDENVILTLLQVILNPNGNPSLKTTSVRLIDLIPVNGSFIESSGDEITRYYYVTWFLYSLSKWLTTRQDSETTKTSQDCLKLIQGCKPLLENSLGKILSYFIKEIKANIHQGDENKLSLSPHQEERFQLLFYMIDYFIEAMPDCMKSLVICVFHTFDTNWTILCDLVQKPTIRIKSLTIFQLFTKIMDDLRKGAKDGEHDEELSRLETIWDRILDQVKPPAPPAAAQVPGPAGAAAK